MFKGLGNLASLMKQASQMSGRMQEVTEQLRNHREVGEAGGGMVQIEVNGAGETLDVRIDETLIENGDKDVLEDLLQAAFNQASAKAKTRHMEAMKDLTGGVTLPGMDDAMSQLFGGGGGGGGEDEQEALGDDQSS